MPEPYPFHPQQLHLTPINFLDLSIATSQSILSTPSGGQGLLLSWDNIILSFLPHFFLLVPLRWLYLDLCAQLQLGELDLPEKTTSFLSLIKLHVHPVNYLKRKKKVMAL